MKIQILADMLDAHYLRQLNKAVEIINGAQRYYNVHKDIKEIELTSDQEINADGVTEKTIDEYLSEFPIVIIVTSKRFDDNWFSHEYRQHSIITLSDWEQIFSPPSLTSYITYQIAQSLINFSGELSEDILLRIVHEPPEGCMMDLSMNKPDIKLGMVAGNLCPKCQTNLNKYGVPQIAISSIISILGYVRAEALGSPILTDWNSAFIVMRFSTNDENDNAYKHGIMQGLQDVGIKPIRADDVVPGGQLLDKIINRVNRCRFTVIKVDVDNLNVFFELGYSMGVGKDVLLISEEKLVLNLPSDLRNWECLTYPCGDYDTLRGNISDFFVNTYHYTRLDS